MNKKSFKIVAIIVGLLLAASMTVQIVWLSGMYRNMNQQYLQKVTSAMERAAYNELLRRISAVSVDTLLNETMSSINTKNITQIRVNKENADAPEIHLYMSVLSKTQSNFNIEVYDSLFRKELNSVGIVSECNVWINRAGRQFHYKSKSGADTFKVRGSVAKAEVRGRVSINQVDSITVSTEQIYSQNSLPDRIYKNPIELSFPVNQQAEELCHIKIENPNSKFLSDMFWVFFSSGIIFLLLCLSFVYLIMTIFKQKSLEEMRRDFTHNITHELKTPIAVAYAANDAMANFDMDKNPQKRKEYLEVVGIQLNMLSSMVERILSLSVEESEMFELKRDKVLVLPILEELIHTLSVKYPVVIKFNIEVHPEELSLYADEFHLRNALMNLLDNAVKYSGESPEIKITASESAIVIEDNGPGIPPSHRHRVFEKYYRISTGDRHDVKGFGIGLYYVLLVVKRHGWSISVSSSYCDGAKFTISIIKNTSYET